MKEFVIKNKEGKYWCGNNIFSATIDIRKTYICEDFDFISKVINKLSSEGLLKDCEVVEITIAETKDLEKDFVTKNYHDVVVENYKKEMSLQEKKTRHQVCEEIRNYMTQDDCLTKEELIECLESFTAKQIFNLLDQIEKGE